MAELQKEYNRLGRTLSGDEFLEPEAVVRVAKQWMMQHAKQSQDGKVMMPPRVKHPGKSWIMAYAAQADDPSTAAEAPHPAVATQPPAVPKAVEGTTTASNIDPKKSIEHEFKIIYRDVGHRLIMVNFVGKRLGDVPLPPNSNFRLILSEGRYLLSGQGGSKLYDVEEYMATLMPPPPPPKAAPAGQNYDTFSFVCELIEIRSSVYHLRSSRPSQ